LCLFSNVMAHAITHGATERSVLADFDYRDPDITCAIDFRNWVMTKPLVLVWLLGQQMTRRVLRSGLG